jgi:excisionase family DNA binding protein
VGERFTPEELAALWKCSPRTVRDRCQRGEIRAFRVGDLWRIPADAVAEYEARQANRQPATPTVSPLSQTYTSADMDGEYVPIVPGVVPWRTEVVAAAPAAGRARGAGKKKAAVSAN